MATILIIDDEKPMCDLLSQRVKKMGHEAVCALTLKDGLSLLQTRSFDAVFLDVVLPDGNGLDALPEIRSSASPPEVIIMTGLGDADGAEMAIKNGAWDYLEKPFSSKVVTLSLKRILQYREALQRSHQPAIALDLEGIVGKSRAIKRCYDALAHAASDDVNVLITGETGTGKELFARAIHNNSDRANNNFVVVDCAALPQTLIESTLFGYKKGAFTGADKSQDGLIKQADGGTLFLDEIGELPPAIQRPFLRVLQERLFRPVGGTDEVKSDFRLISATNRELDKMIEDGLFREDLIYRLRSLAIHLPPLRERTEDIRDLVMHFMARLCDRHHMAPKGFSPDFFDVLASYDWPGNVRELSNVIERIIAKAKHESTLFSKHLPDPIRIKVKRASMGKGEAVSDEKRSPATEIPDALETYHEFKGTVLAQAEKEYFERLIQETKGNIKEACRISGLSRSRLYTLIKKYNVSTNGWERS